MMENEMLKQGLLALLIVMTAPAGIAHAQQKKGANGGMVVTSQGHPIEFVVKGQDLVFYINDDDGSPLSTKEVRGRATVQDGGKTTTVPLEPAAPNMMVGKLQVPLGSKARVVFSANLHGHALTARYVTE
jgi:hypothetical protein